MLNYPVSIYKPNAQTTALVMAPIKRAYYTQRNTNTAQSHDFQAGTTEQNNSENVAMERNEAYGLNVEELQATCQNHSDVVDSSFSGCSEFDWKWDMVQPANNSASCLLIADIVL